MKAKKKKNKFKNFEILFVGFLLLTNLTSAQLLEIDYSKDKREESSVRVHFIKILVTDP